MQSPAALSLVLESKIDFFLRLQCEDFGTCMYATGPLRSSCERATIDQITLLLYIYTRTQQFHYADEKHNAPRTFRNHPAGCSERGVVGGILSRAHM